ncbi:type II toxin-antitoxin system VapC family toxin [Mesorhizobium sp. J428]|uniref:type II toxin-antitoxin system VapC family toxin n=1 Tax=Mesorhizobium sp. J428 TaxID=2898440 RepID=UPI002151F290|nr:type II toxin-antitoxin system VapC family toxin [Mesorhizobium sp. J428]MCR5858723.1 type II toxin-antitoxin system VapC family toxin [Mesorhizobium sp. J428]
MRLLLDTHIAIWAAKNPERIAEAVRLDIEDAGNEVVVSVVAIWEIAIKRQLDRNDPPPFSATEAIDAFSRLGFQLLDVTATHAAKVETLPLHHGDPFDRLMVAQALCEPMRLITHDKRLTAYTDLVTYVP